MSKPEYVRELSRSPGTFEALTGHAESNRI